MERKYRVYWQHPETYNEWSYPRVAPYFTKEEAEQKAKEERSIGLRSWVIDENGLLC